MILLIVFLLTMPLKSDFIQGIVVKSSEIKIVQWDNPRWIFRIMDKDITENIKKITSWIDVINKEKIKKYLSDSEYVFVHGHFIENQIELYFQYAEFRKLHHNLESHRTDPDNMKNTNKPRKIYRIDCVSVGEIQSIVKGGSSHNICINGLETSILKVDYSEDLLLKKPLNKVIKIKSPCLHLGPFISKHQLRIIVDGLR